MLAQICGKVKDNSLLVGMQIGTAVMDLNQKNI